MPRSIFISYHHANDQYYCDTFRNFYCNDFQIFSDNSLQRRLNSDNASYIDRRVREDYIRGSSITIVLCGRDTRFRKFVDWEISDTLLYDHALLGIILPTCEISYDAFSLNNKPLLPSRLQDNLDSGYANLIHWTLDHWALNNAVEQAIRQKSLLAKRNARPHMQINSYRRYSW